MSAGNKIAATLKRGVIFFVDSTLFVSVGPAAITCGTIILTKNPFTWQLVLLPFFACLLIYSVNRMTDHEEDAINMPDRILFPHRIRIILVVVSLVFTILLLTMVLQKNILSFVIGVLPMVIAFLYSVLRLKRVFILKNLLIAAAVCSSVLIVPAYYENWSGGWGWLFLFFFLLVFLNTIIFDIKDIRGDSFFGIRTLPLRLGVPATRYFCYFLLATALVVLFPLLSINQKSVLLIPYVSTIATYTHYVPEGEHFPWWYFGVLVDGEFFVLLLTLFFVLMLL
jgi:4-hydroxybenzoate polyprenyltransferase